MYNTFKVWWKHRLNWGTQLESFWWIFLKMSCFIHFLARVKLIYCLVLYGKKCKASIHTFTYLRYYDWWSKVSKWRKLYEVIQASIFKKILWVVVALSAAREPVNECGSFQLDRYTFQTQILLLEQASSLKCKKWFTDLSIWCLNKFVKRNYSWGLGQEKE